MSAKVTDMNRIVEGTGYLQESPLFEEIELIDLTEDAKKANPFRLLMIRGTASRGGVVNRNDRIYPTSVLNKVAETAQDRIRKGKLLGEVDHPEIGTRSRLQNAAMKYTKVWMEGDYMKFEADVMPTEQGKQLEVLLRSGVGVGISTRGYGSLKDVNLNGRYVQEVQPDYELKAIDAVLDESNEWSKVANFESEQGGRKMEITLESLKKDHPEIVTQLEAELKEKVSIEVKEQVTKDLEKDFELKVNAELEKKMEEARAKIRQEVMDSDEIKQLKDIASAVVEAVKPLVPAQTKEEADEKLKTELAKIQAESEAKDGKIKTLESEKETAEKKLEERETRDKVVAKVEETVKGHRFETQLRSRLSECLTEEEVGKRFESEVKFIESLLGGKEPPKGSGELDESKDDKPDLDETRQRHRLLAGIKEEGGK